MRLNAKTAKELRAEARYRNQSVTPSRPEFPGIARFYTHPVYMTRTATYTTYERRDGFMVRIFHKRTSMHVVCRKGKEPTVPMLMVQHAYPAYLPGPDGKPSDVSHPKAGETYMGPKLEMVPVSKPIHASGEKKVYRSLKRLHAQGLLAPGVLDIPAIERAIAAGTQLEAA